MNKLNQSESSSVDLSEPADDFFDSSNEPLKLSDELLDSSDVSNDLIDSSDVWWLVLL